MIMKKFAMAALGALMMAGGTAATTTPADARVSIGIGIGIPGPAYGYDSGYRYSARFCDPYSYAYDPYRCDEERYGDDYYYDPIFFGGEWYRGPFRYRRYNGYPEYWVGGGWHRNEWRGARPSHFEYHGGWHGDRGGWHGHDHGGWHHHH
jgi:hypothetical protein